MDYQKPPLTTEQHIKQLKQRGLNIPNEQRATNYLDHIGYYRLSAYGLPFEHKKNASNQRSHTFLDNTSFDDILQLYTRGQSKCLNFKMVKKFIYKAHD